MKRRKRYLKHTEYRWAAIKIITLFAASLLIMDKSYVSAASEVPPPVNEGAADELPDTNTLSSETGNASAGQEQIVIPEPENTPDPAAEEEGDEEGASTEEETTGVMDAPQISDNSQKKTYSIQADAMRIREQTGEMGSTMQDNDSALQEDDLVMKNVGAGVDTTLLLLLGITVFSILLIFYSYKKLKQLLFTSQKRTDFSGKSSAASNKAKKRKKARRTKKKRTTKEAKSGKTSV